MSQNSSQYTHCQIAPAMHMLPEQQISQRQQIVHGQQIMHEQQNIEGHQITQRQQIAPGQHIPLEQQIVPVQQIAPGHQIAPGLQVAAEEVAQCSKDAHLVVPPQVFSASKGPMRVCLKRPDGSMVEQTHLRVSHTKDGKFVINTNGQNQPIKTKPQPPSVKVTVLKKYEKIDFNKGGQWMQNKGTTIRTILIDNKQGGGSPVNLPAGARIVSPSSVLSSAPQRVPQAPQLQRVSPIEAPLRNSTSYQPRQNVSPGTAAAAQKIAPKSNRNHASVNNAGLKSSPYNRQPVHPKGDSAAPKPAIQRDSYERPVNSTSSARVAGSMPAVRPTNSQISVRPSSIMPSTRPALQSQFSQEQHMIHPPPAPAARQTYCGPQTPVQLVGSLDYKAQAPPDSKQQRVAQHKTAATPLTPQMNRMPTSTTTTQMNRMPTSTTTTPARTSNTPARWSNNSVLNGISTISNGGSRKRASPVQYDVKPTPPAASDRKRPRCSSERGGKGLRHFSSKVCEKVKSKGVTTYLEVSEELVEEFSQQSVLMSTPSSANSFDVKNIRRRVYDALNVLCAMNIISKDKKEIRWIGLPTNSLQECRQLEKYKSELQQRIKDKKKRAQEFMLQLIAYKTLIERNTKMEEKMRRSLPENATIQVPFIILSTGANTQIGLEVADDKTEYEFTFNEIFEIHDEIGILKKMGFCYGLESGEFSPEGFAEAARLLPKSARPFLQELFPRKSDEEVKSEPQLEIVKHPQQISVKHEPPQELSDVEKQALETYSFDGPIYSSGYTEYNNDKPRIEVSDTQGGASSSDKSRDAANTLLSLTTVS